MKGLAEKVETEFVFATKEVVAKLGTPVSDINGMRTYEIPELKEARVEVIDSERGESLPYKIRIIAPNNTAYDRILGRLHN